MRTRIHDIAATIGERILERRRLPAGEHGQTLDNPTDKDRHEQVQPPTNKDQNKGQKYEVASDPKNLPPLWATKNPRGGAIGKYITLGRESRPGERVPR